MTEWPRPTLEQFVRHAEKFGTECVAETARFYLGEKLMARLMVELDAVDRNQKGRYGFTNGRRRRRSADETKSAVVQLSVEGLVPSAIADKLGLSDDHVKRILRA